MTIEELKNTPHIAVAEIVPDMFFHLHAEEGYYFTSYVEGDDIKTYGACECFYAPISNTGKYNLFRQILPKEEHEKLQALCEQAHEEEMKKQQEEYKASQENEPEAPADEDKKEELV